MSKKGFKNILDLLRKSDDRIYSAYGSWKDKMEGLLKEIELSQKKQAHRRNVKRISSARRWSRMKTMRSLAENISGEIENSVKGRILGDIRKKG